MHHNRAAEAGPQLEGALRRLDPAHPDTVYARHHLNALQAGQPGNCGDSWEALAEQLRAYVLRQVPEGVLADLQLRLEDGDVKVNAYLAREATPEELERLQIVLNQAVYTFKERVGRRTRYAVRSGCLVGVPALAGWGAKNRLKAELQPDRV